MEKVKVVEALFLEKKPSKFNDYLFATRNKNLAIRVGPLNTKVGENPSNRKGVYSFLE